MSSLLSVVSLPARFELPRIPPRRLIVGAVLLLAVLVAGAWYISRTVAATSAREAAIAAARSRAVAAARAHHTVAASGRPATKVPARPARVADAKGLDLFAVHSWYVPPPPPPPPPVVAPAPPPAPVAPPFPYAFLGSYAPGGDKTVYFLSRDDRVIDASIGDHLDGVYEFESADGSQLVFNYLPLNTRQALATGATQ